MQKKTPNTTLKAEATMKRNHWLDLFAGTTWEEFQQAGSSVSGFREGRWKTVQKIVKGDYLLCYNQCPKCKP